LNFVRIKIRAHPSCNLQLRTGVHFLAACCWLFGQVNIFLIAINAINITSANACSTLQVRVERNLKVVWVRRQPLSHSNSANGLQISLLV
jgi:hypothetical protein